MKDLTIVTSSCGYGQYLREWAESIIGQTQRPGAVAIFTHGEPDGFGKEAEALLRDAGFSVQREHSPERLDFGEARNRAVALSASEWVMHFDADDTLMPHAVAEIAKLAPHADVVAIGYERSGDLAAGPKNLRKTYQRITGPEVLTHPTPASGVSPFRRRLWEQSPYRTDLIGGWDTALWIGFGHLGARIVPTSQPCFWYRQHADSVFNTRRKTGWEAAWCGKKFNSLRRKDSGVAFIVPIKRDGGARDRAWAWLRRRWEALYPDWRIVEGELSGQWNKGEAIAKAVEKSGAEILIIADADCIHPAEALRKAVRLVEGGAPWVVPHTKVHRLSEAQTREWLTSTPSLDRPAPLTGLQRSAYDGFAGGGCLVVARATYDAAGGMPVAFQGWGCEDEALAMILDTLAGPHIRLPDPLVHLWHPLQPERRGQDYRRNRGLLAQFSAACGSKGTMWSLVQRGATAGGDPYLQPSWRHRTVVQRGVAMRDNYANNRGDFFMRRQLEQQHIRNTAAREAAAEERKQLAQAYKAGQVARRSRKMLTNLEHASVPVLENKLAPEIVAEPEAETLPGLTVRFANYKAHDLATESGLTDAAFAGLEPGPMGFTMAQVRGLLGD